MSACYLDLQTLNGQKALPSDVEAVKVLKLYSDDYTEVVVVELDSSSKLRRSLCTRTARSWKENRLIKPLLIFTNGTDSFAVIVPGKGIGGARAAAESFRFLHRPAGTVMIPFSHNRPSPCLSKSK